MGSSDTKQFNSKLMLKYVSTIFSWTVFALLSVVGVLLIYYFLSSKLYATQGEKFEPAFSIYTIVSGSMEPTINVYDVIINSKIDDNEKIKVNDVVTFTSTSTNTAGMTITHRVVGVRNLDDGSLCYVTRGDNNTNEDTNCVARKNIIGKVSAVIPQLGRIQFFLASKFGWLLVIVIPALYIVVKDVLKIIRLSKKNEEIQSEMDEDPTIAIPIIEKKVEKYVEYVPENKDIASNSIDDNYFENKENTIINLEPQEKVEEVPFQYYDIDKDSASPLE